jgi:4-hydroxy-tetrahydrodipicolinate reductase
MNKIKICLVGAGGRMGLSISEAILESKNSTLISAIENKNFSRLGQKVSGHEILFSKDLEDGVKNSDVIIDFGSPENTIHVLQAAAKYKKPLVIGVTGLKEEFIYLLKNESLKFPILQSANMSIGVNLLFKLVELGAKVIGESFDIEILDIHHRHKKDSPSGTARELKNILLKTLNRTEENVIYGRIGNEYPERNDSEIAIHSMRAGEVVGDHTVHFISADERVEISHKALHRKTFAVGSVKAAEFIVNQKMGLYSMFDVLGL